MTKGNNKKPANGSALDFEAQLWAAENRDEYLVANVFWLPPTEPGWNGTKSERRRFSGLAVS